MDSNQLQVWEPTYRMAPEDDERFRPSASEKIIEDVLTSKLEDKTYNVDEAKQWTLELTNEIKEAMKKENIPRYKIVVQVAIAEDAGQGIRVASKCLWDVAVDNWASVTYKNKSILAVAMVFGCYLE